MQDTGQKAYFFFTSPRSLRWSASLRGGEKLWEHLSQDSTHQTDATNLFADAVRRPAHKPLGTPYLQTPPSGLWTPPTIHASPTPPIRFGLILAYAPTDHEIKPLQMASEQMQKVTMTLGWGKGSQTWAFQDTTLEKTNERLSALGLALGDWDKANCNKGWRRSICNDKRVISLGGYNSCKFLCTQHRSIWIY